MKRQGHESAKFFVGTEVEHTLAFGKTTLFVVGIQRTEDILKHYHENYCDHIYFGANMSFPKIDTDDSRIWKQWENMIQVCLDSGILCTLDIDASCVEGLLESFLVENHLFIPMISVKIPYINQLGYNATIKIDDKDFKATNPGVWCHSIHDLQQRDRFTDWSQYTQDKVIE